jgi:HAD superfamily hydrolase (TIGR01457 family)
MDGTFYLGDQLVEGAMRFIHTIIAQGRDFIFLTNNSSKNTRLYAEKFSRLGLAIPESKVYTSGEATACYLARIYPQARLYVVGTSSLEDEFHQHGFQLTDDQPDVVVLGFDTTLTYQKLWKLCDFVRVGLPYIATHPDYNCPTDKGFMPDIGAIIAFVKASTDREPDQVIGKPNRIIIDELAQKLNLPINQLAMIGDRLYTDIALGQTSGITTVLVLSGETHLSDLDQSPFKPTCIFNNLGEIAEHLKRLEG